MSCLEYRVWNILEKKFMDEGSGITIKPDGKIGMFFWNHGKINFKFMPKEENIVSLYSGKSDIDGKDIFDGDILQFENYEEQRSLVLYDNEKLVWKLDPVGKKFIEDQKMRNEILRLDVYSLSQNAKSLKIIGNKFENPELLKNE